MRLDMPIESDNLSLCKLPFMKKIGNFRLFCGDLLVRTKDVVD